MTHRIPSTILLATCLAVAAGCGKSSPESATLVLTNASVYTADASRSVSEALAVRDDTIVYVGDDEGVAAFIGEDTVVRDMGGAMLMPGLHDMHIHALGIVEPDSCDLKSVAYSLAELVPVLQACIEDHDVAPGEWLIVLQWAFSQGNQPSADYPNMRVALDAVSTEHPIFLYGDDGHHGAANSLALAMAKTLDGRDVPINAETLAGEYADFRSMFGLDAKGEPTGGVNEEARLLIRASWFEDMLGMTGTEYGLFFACTPIGFMFGNFLTGRYSNEVGLTRMMIIGTVVAIVGVLIIAALFALGVVHPLALFLPMFLSGMANGMTFANSIAGAVSLRPQYAGTASGLAGSMQVTGGAIASVLIGILMGAIPSIFTMLATMLVFAVLSFGAAVWAHVKQP